ncbi:MAG: type II toxin-antitoxin system mRNA interferase toxin, RelE/StbE family [Patescibacteria group bacterium]
MEIILRKNFKKEYEKLRPEIKEKFKERRNLYVQDRFNTTLNNHSVDSAYPGCRSINITGDYRAIFKEENDIITFLYIGTHSQLYG